MSTYLSVMNIKGSDRISDLLDQMHCQRGGRIRHIDPWHNSFIIAHFPHPKTLTHIAIESYSSFCHRVDPNSHAYSICYKNNRQSVTFS